MLEDPDLPAIRPPWWKNRLLLVAIAAGGGFTAYGMMQPPPVKPEVVEQPAQTFIGALSTYEKPVTKVEKKTEEPKGETPAKEENKPAPKEEKPPVTDSKPKEEAPPAAPFDLRGMMGGKGQQETNPLPADVAYAVPSHKDIPKPPPTDPTANQTKVAFEGTTFKGAKASPSFDDTCWLHPGLLPIQLDVKIDSTYPGPIIGHTIGPIYSRKGVPLIEAGSQVIGRYETLGNGGQKRLQASSAVVTTNNNVMVPLIAPLSDGLGTSGLPVGVDPHYLERFGGATMLMLTESALGIIQASVSKGGNSYLQLNSGGGVGSLAQDIFRAQANIAPTATKNPGEFIAIFLDHNISFEDSYKVGNHCHG